MPALLLSILGPLLPYLAGLLAVIAGYFAIKHRGVTQEKAREAAAVAKVQAKVEVAKSKDAAIDAKVEEKIEAIKEAHKPDVASGDVFKF